MSNCNSCGGSMDPQETEYYIGPECWNGKCHTCAVHSPGYAEHLEAELADAKAELESARIYAAHLLNHIAPGIELLPNVDGMISQLDNYIAVLTQQPTQGGGGMMMLHFYKNEEGVHLGDPLGDSVSLCGDACEGEPEEFGQMKVVPPQKITCPRCLEIICYCHEAGLRG